MSRRRCKMLISLLAVLAVATAIFLFSAQEGGASGRFSRRVAVWLLSRLMPGYRGLGRIERLKILYRFGRFVRKAAHFTEFMLLGGTLSAFLHYVLEGRRYRWVAASAWVLAALYACTDEWHQMFVNGRSPAIMDVGIDAAGALTGALIGVAAIRLRHRLKRKTGRPREGDTME